MNINPTQEAIDKLIYMFPDRRPTIKVAYDTEGCGCAVNGVVQLWLTNDLEQDDVVGYNQDVRMIYSSRQEVFFEDIITLGYNQTDRTFVIKSNSQIYNASASLIDKTGGSLQ